MDSSTLSGQRGAPLLRGCQADAPLAIHVGVVHRFEVHLRGLKGCPEGTEGAAGEERGPRDAFEGCGRTRRAVRARRRRRSRTERRIRLDASRTTAEGARAHPVLLLADARLNEPRGEKREGGGASRSATRASASGIRFARNARARREVDLAIRLDGRAAGSGRNARGWRRRRVRPGKESQPAR